MKRLKRRDLRKTWIKKKLKRSEERIKWRDLRKDWRRELGKGLSGAT